MITNPRLSAPRPVVQVENSDFELHKFADTSNVANCAAVYVVEYEEEKVMSWDKRVVNIKTWRILAKRSLLA